MTAAITARFLSAWRSASRGDYQYWGNLAICTDLQCAATVLIHSVTMPRGQTYVFVLPLLPIILFAPLIHLFWSNLLVNYTLAEIGDGKERITVFLDGQQSVVGQGSAPSRDM